MLQNATLAPSIYSNKIFFDIAKQPIYWIALWITSFVFVMLLIIYLTSCLFSMDSKIKDSISMAENSSTIISVLEPSTYSCDCGPEFGPSSKAGAAFHDKAVGITDKTIKI